MYDLLHAHKRISLMKVLAPIIVEGPHVTILLEV